MGNCCCCCCGEEETPLTEKQLEAYENDVQDIHFTDFVKTNAERKTLVALLKKYYDLLIRVFQAYAFVCVFFMVEKMRIRKFFVVLAHLVEKQIF